MRVSGKRQGINKWINGSPWSADFQRRKSKCKIKCKDVNKDKGLTNFTLSVLFVIYKREEVEIRHEQLWYNKEQLLSLTSTQLFFFDKDHIQKVSGPPATSMVNRYNIRFPRYEEREIYVKTSKYDTNNQPKKATLKYEQEGIFFLGVAKIENKNGTITGKRCPIFDYSGVKIVTINDYKK